MSCQLAVRFGTVRDRWRWRWRWWSRSGGGGAGVVGGGGEVAAAESRRTFTTSGGSVPMLRHSTSATDTVFMRSLNRQVGSPNSSIGSRLPNKPVRLRLGFGIGIEIGIWDWD